MDSKNPPSQEAVGLERGNRFNQFQSKKCEEDLSGVGVDGRGIQCMVNAVVHPNPSYFDPLTFCKTESDIDLGLEKKI